MASVTTDLHLQQLQQALQSLYGASDPKTKSEANTFLLEFQRSTHAWDTIFPVLTNTNYSFEVRLFVAQTLRSKVQYDFGQLNDNTQTINQLKTSILNLLCNTTDFKSNKLIVVQLALALVYLTIQDINWQSPLVDIINALQQAPLNLLEFIKILPEELSDYNKLPLSHEEFEAQYKKLLVENSENVYYLLVQVSASTTDTSLDVLLLDCIKSWINEIPVSLILSNDLTLWNKILAGFNNDDTFEASIASLISMINSIDVFEKLQENFKYIELIYVQLVQLKPLIKQNWDDTEIIERLTELYSTTGEAWHLLIVKNPANFNDLIQIIIELTNYSEDLDIVKYTFKFWYEIKSMLVLNNFKESRELFKPIYIQLVEILVSHLKYPTTSTSTNVSHLFNNNKEEEDKFKDFRYEIGDVLKDCCQVIGYYDALNLPFARLQSLIDSSGSVSTVPQWQDIECLLFAIRAMAKEVPKTEGKILPQIMNYLVQLPENPKIRYAATLVLGRYTVWTSANREFLPLELNYIINGFQVQDSGYNEDEKMDIIIATSHALKYFCIDCNELLVDHIESLYNLYSNIEGKIDFKSLYDIVEGLSYVLKNIIDKNIIANETQCLDLLKMFLGSTLQKLNTFITAGTVNNETEVADTIEVLTLFVENLRVPDEILDLQMTNFKVCDYLMAEVFPIVFSVVEKFGSNVKISERCVKFIRKNLLNFKRFLIPALKDIENFLAFGFRTYRFGCYLWCSGTLIKEFSVDDDEYEAEEVIKLNKDTLAEVWAFAVQQIESFVSIYKETGSAVDTDLMEDFYRMMNDVLMFKTLEMLNNFEIVQVLFGISMEITRTVSEFEILKLVIEHLIDLFSWCLESPPVSIFFDIPQVLKAQIYALINENEETILNNFLNSSIVKFNEDLIYLSIELIMEIFKINTEFGQPNKNLSYIEKFLNSLPTELLSNSEKMRFFTNFQSAMRENNLRKMRSNLLDFIHWYKRKIVNRS